MTEDERGALQELERLRNATEYAELPKLTDGKYLETAYANAANSADRVRSAAEKAWAIAGALGGLLIALGFTQELQDAPAIVQASGIAAIVLWLAAAMLFIRVSLPAGENDLKPYFDAAAEEAENARIDAEQPRSTSPIEQRAGAMSLKVLANRDFSAHRLRQAIWTSWTAIGATALALGLLIAVPPDDTSVFGTLALTPEGETALAAGCPLVDGSPVGGDQPHLVDIPPIEGTVDLTDLGEDGSLLRLELEAGLCQDTTAVIYLRPELFLGVVDP